MYRLMGNKMNVLKISLVDGYHPETDRVYTNLQVTFENGNAKYIEFTHPIDIKTLAAGFNTFAIMLNEIK